MQAVAASVSVRSYVRVDVVNNFHLILKIILYSLALLLSHAAESTKA